MQIHTFIKYTIKVSMILIILAMILACGTPENNTIANIQGGTVKIGIPIWFDHISPTKENSTSYSAWGPGIAYSRILRQSNVIDLESPHQSTQIICDICEKWEMKNSTEFNFLIKDDVRWSNLQLSNYEDYLSAYDIEFSLQKNIQPSSPNNHTLHMVKNIEANSDTDLTISLNYPDSDFLMAMASGKNKIIKKGHTYEDSNIKSLVSSGAWALEEYIPYTSTRMIKSISAETTPNLNSLEFIHIPDDEARYSAYMVGLTDIYSLDDSENTFGEIEPNLYYHHSGLGIEMIINTEISPFDNIELRQALMYSVSPNQIIEEAWSGKGYFSLGFPVSNADWLPNSIWQQYFNNLPKSRDILTNSGIPLPIPIEITSSNYGNNYVKSVEIISKTLEEVGFDPTIKLLNRREYATNSWTSGNFQINIGPTFPQSSTNGYLLPVLHSNGKWNTSNHKNEYLDDLLLKQSHEYNHIQRTKLIESINLEILNNAYRFMPVTKVEAWDWKENIQNFNPILSNDEYYHWAQISITP